MNLASSLLLDAPTWITDGRESVSEMVSAGRLTAADPEEPASTEVPVPEDLAAPEMAVRAVGRVLADTGWGPARIGLVAHGRTYHQGHDFGSADHRRLGGLRRLPSCHR